MGSETVRAALCASTAACVFWAVPAAAQDNSAPTATQSNAQTQAAPATGSDQEIVVTARRRNERLLNVPVAVTAYTGEQLERQLELGLVRPVLLDQQVHQLVCGVPVAGIGRLAVQGFGVFVAAASLGALGKSVDVGGVAVINEGLPGAVW